MTPEETREHVQRRLSDLGWNVHIGRAGYDKIFQATGGAETETNRICHKLISVGAGEESREITDATVDLAVTDAMRREARPRRAPADSDEADRAVIERLAAILEAKQSSQEARPQSTPAPTEPGRSADETVRPTALVVLSSGEARAHTADALARDFRVLQAADGERAWSMLREQPEIGVVVIERAFAEANGHSLPRRIREEGGPARAALPIVVLGEAREGATRAEGGRAPGVFLPVDADPRELRTRVLASYKANRAPAADGRRAPTEPPARRPADVLFADARFSGTGGRERSGRFASTLAITLCATALLALALVATYYVSRNPEAMGLGAAPRGTETAGAPEASLEQDSSTSEGADADAQPDAAVSAETAPSSPESTTADAPAAQRIGDTATVTTSEQRRANASRAPPAVAGGAERGGEESERGADAATETEAPLPPLARAPEARTPDASPTPGAGDRDAIERDAIESANGGADSTAREQALWESLEQQAPAASPGTDSTATAEMGRESNSERSESSEPGSAREPPSSPAAADSARGAPSTATRSTESAPSPSASARSQTDPTPSAGPAPVEPLTPPEPPVPAESPPARARPNSPPTDAETSTARREPAAQTEASPSRAEERPSPRQSPPPLVQERAPTPPRSEPAQPPASGAVTSPPSGGQDAATAGGTSAPARREPATSTTASPPSQAPAAASTSPPESRQAPATAAVPRPSIEGPPTQASAPVSPPAADSPPPSPATAAVPRPSSEAPPAQPSAPVSPPATDSPPPEPNAETRTRLATMRPAPASPAGQEISRDELLSLVQRFASVYEAGDLEQFLSLFAEDARTNDRAGRDGIRKDYAALFGSTDLREMNLGELNWEVDGNQAYGWGEFEVTVRRQSDRQAFAYTGSLTFVVEKVDGSLRIVRLFHGQQRTDS